MLTPWALNNRTAMCWPASRPIFRIFRKEGSRDLLQSHIPPGKLNIFLHARIHERLHVVGKRSS